jgi:hypothetical protein
MDLFRLVPLLFRLVQHRDAISRLIALLAPVGKQLQASGPEIVTLIRRLMPEAFPEVERILSDDTLVRFDVKWLQESLNKLGQNLEVDGDYGPATKKAVWHFQQEFMGADQADGWAGIATCSALYHHLRQKGLV